MIDPTTGSIASGCVRREVAERGVHARPPARRREKERRGVAERREVDLAVRCARARVQPVDGGARTPGPRRHRTTREVVGHAELPPARGPCGDRVDHRARAEHAARRRRTMSREDRDAVERRHAGTTPAVRHEQPAVGLQPDDAVEGRRHPPRARRCRCRARARPAPWRRRPPSPSSSRRRCSAGRSTLRARRSAASACRPGRWRTGRGWSCRCTTAPASSSRCTTVGGALGHVGEGRAAGGGRQAGDVDVVLDRERHAGERQRRPTGSGVHRPGRAGSPSRGEAADPGLRLDPVVAPIRSSVAHADFARRPDRAGVHRIGELACLHAAGSSANSGAPGVTCWRSARRCGGRYRRGT